MSNFTCQDDVLLAVAAGELSPQEAIDAIAELSKPKPPRTKLDVLTDLANQILTQEEAAAEFAEITARESAEAEAKAKKANRKGGTGKRAGTILGYSATSVVRWLGQEGVSYAEAKAIVDHYCGDNTLSKATIKIQLNAGKNGTRGDVAPLTEEQAEELGIVMLNAGCDVEELADVEESCMTNDSLANALMV